MEKFLEMNPCLLTCYGSGLTDQGDRKFDMIIDICMISQKYYEIPAELEVYFDYISAVIELYTMLCSGRNLEGLRTVRERIGGTIKCLLLFAAS